MQDDLREPLVAALESMAGLAERAGMKGVAREIRTERVPAIRQQRLNMVVLGEFNHGKSTLINALLGTPVLPTGITPTTAVITHVRYGSGTPVVVREDGAHAVTWEELQRLLTEEQGDSLRHVEIPLMSPLLAQGLQIVDTPGVNDISRQKVEITYGYVPRADVILYVLDATQALKRSEVAFLRDRLLQGVRQRMFFLLGKMDALTDDEAREVVSHVEGRLRELVGPQAPLYPVSARRAMAGQDPGFERFRQDIDAWVRQARTQVVVESGIRTGLRLASVMDQSLGIEQAAMSLGLEELERRVAKIQAKLQGSQVMVTQLAELIDQRTAELRSATEQSVSRFVREFATAIPQQVARASTDDVRRYLPDFVHDTFREWLEEEGLLVAARLEQIAEEVIEVTNRNMRDVVRSVEKELGGAARDINLEVDTFGLDVGVFALGALGLGFLAFSNLLVGGLLTLAAPVLAFVLRDRVDDAIRTRAIEQGVEAVNRAGQQVQNRMVEHIDEFGARLRQFVTDTGNRVYRQIEESLGRVVEQRREHDGNQDGMRGDLDTWRREVGQHLHRLQDLQARAAAVQEGGTHQGLGDDDAGVTHDGDPPLELD
jgi:GTP-binding protein EngB required for normal cell division